MDLSLRLRTIADLVPEGSRLADIGTDHGYLPITLLQEGKIPSAIAMDIGKGPLERARIHYAEQSGRNPLLKDKMQLRLSDGFAALEEGEADCAAICGMGGLLMVKILEQGLPVARSLKTLILSPQSDLAAFRTWLLSNGFRIADEVMVYDEEKYYTIMKAEPGFEDVKTWSEAQLRYGKLLIQKKGEVFLAYMNKEAQKLAEIEEKLRSVGTEKANERLAGVAHEKQLVEEALASYR